MSKEDVEDVTEELRNASIDEEDDDEEDGDFGENLPPGMLKKVVALKGIQDSVAELETEYKKERIALEAKYRDLKIPFFDKRFQIISGAIEVPDEPDAPAPSSEAAEDEEDAKGIPGFWLQCLANHPAIGDIITEEDIPALEALADIKCEYNEDYTSFTVLFHFNENPFFSNQVLKKTYTVSPDLLDDKSPALTGHDSSAIEWLPGKNLTITEVKKKQKAKSGKNKGQVRTIVKEEPKASFFQYFGEPTKDEDEEEEEEDDEKPRVQLTVEEDYDIGHAIRTAIIPEAVLWFTGEAVEDEDDEDDEGLDYEALDDDEDDDEDDDGEAPKLKAVPGGGFAAAPGAPGPNGEQPECKQN